MSRHLGVDASGIVDCSVDAARACFENGVSKTRTHDVALTRALHLGHTDTSCFHLLSEPLMQVKSKSPIARKLTLTPRPAPSSLTMISPMSLVLQHGPFSTSPPIPADSHNLFPMSTSVFGLTSTKKEAARCTLTADMMTKALPKSPVLCLIMQLAGRHHRPAATAPARHKSDGILVSHFCLRLYRALSCGFSVPCQVIHQPCSTPVEPPVSACCLSGHSPPGGPASRSARPTSAPPPPPCPASSRAAAAACAPPASRSVAAPVGTAPV